MISSNRNITILHIFYIFYNKKYQANWSRLFLATWGGHFFLFLATLLLFDIFLSVYYSVWTHTDMRRTLSRVHQPNQPKAAGLNNIPGVGSGTVLTSWQTSSQAFSTSPWAKLSSPQAWEFHHPTRPKEVTCDKSQWLLPLGLIPIIMKHFKHRVMRHMKSALCTSLDPLHFA